MALVAYDFSDTSDVEEEDENAAPAVVTLNAKNQGYNKQNRSNDILTYSTLILLSFILLDNLYQ